METTDYSKLDLEKLENFTIYFELDLLSNQLEYNKDDDDTFKFKDSLDELTLLHYEDSLDSL